MKSNDVGSKSRTLGHWVDKMGGCLARGLYATAAPVPRADCVKPGRGHTARVAAFRMPACYVGLSSLLLLSACSGSGSSPQTIGTTSAQTSSEKAAPLTGLVHGGQSPIIESTVTVWAAGVPASAAPTQVAQTTTDTNGNFSIPAASLNCASASSLLYVVAAGGNAGGGANSAIKLMGALGPCAARPTSIVINELTTVAAVYALNGFSNVAGTTTSSGGGLGGCEDCTPGASTADMTQLHGASPGIGNAFATAALLVNVNNGQIAASLPSESSCSAATATNLVNCNLEEKLSSLGNSLAACVNSTSPSSSQCSALFTCALPGAASGACAAGGIVTLSDTLEAALSIARNPGLVSVGDIYTLATRNPVFTPTLTAAPNDWSLAYSYSVVTLAAGVQLGALAIDGQGNVWTIPSSGNTAYFFRNPTLSVSPISLPAVQDNPTAIAVDVSGDGWVLDENGNLTQIGGGVAPSGGTVFLAVTCPTLLSSAAGSASGAGVGSGLTIDRESNLWVLDKAGHVSGLTSASPTCPTPMTGSPFTLPGVTGTVTSSIAADAGGDLWIPYLAGESSFDVAELGPGLVPIGHSPFSDATGVTFEPGRPGGMAVAPTGNVWVAYAGCAQGLRGHLNVCAGAPDAAFLTAVSPSGTQLAPAAGYSLPSDFYGRAIAVDGAGNVWSANAGSTGVSEWGPDGQVLAPNQLATVFDSGSLSAGGLTGTGIGIDGAGNVWATALGGDLIELIGAAASTLTPIAAQITPPPATLVSLSVTPATISIYSGATQQFTATGTYSDGSIKSLTAQVAWASSNTAVATVAANGLVTGIAAGTATITATPAGGAPVATAALTVTGPPPVALSSPNGLAIAPNGNLYVANYGSGQVLVYTPSGGQMVQVPGSNLSAGLSGPVRVAFDAAGDLYVADVGANAILVFGANGTPLTAATISAPHPLGVAVDNTGVVYVAENQANAVAVFSYPSGLSAAAVAGPLWTGDSTGLQFIAPGALAFNGADILVGSAGSGSVSFYTPAALQSTSAPLTPAASAITTSLDGPTGIAFDAGGDIYVSNYYNGTVTEFSSTGSQIALSLTGTPSPALANPEGVAIDGNGNIYVTNMPNNSILVYNASGAYQYTLH